MCAGLMEKSGWIRALVEMHILKQKKFWILLIDVLAFLSYSQYPKYNKRRQTKGDSELNALFKIQPADFQFAHITSFLFFSGNFAPQGRSCFFVGKEAENFF